MEFVLILQLTHQLVQVDTLLMDKEIVSHLLFQLLLLLVLLDITLTVKEIVFLIQYH